MKENNSSVVANWNIVTLCLIVVVTLSLLVMYMPGMREIDMEMLKATRKFLGQFPSYIPLAVTDFGRANWMLWPQITAYSILISHKKYLKTFLYLFFTQASFAITGLLKNFVCRERPTAATTFSFPSGHALTTMCFYGIGLYLILKYVHNTFWRWFFGITFSLFIFLVAISRMWLNVHFLTDVIAGLFVGFLLVNLFIILDKFFSKS